MRIYWALKSVPELADLPKEIRNRVHNACFNRHFLYAPTTWRSLMAYFAFLVCVVSIGILGQGIVRAFGWEESFWSFLVPLWIGGFVGERVFRSMAIGYLHPFYREFIRREVNPA